MELQVDWDKWVDEDEEDDAAPAKNDFDMGDLQNFSNFGGGDFGAGLGGGLSGIGNVEVQFLASMFTNSLAALIPCTHSL